MCATAILTCSSSCPFFTGRGININEIALGRSYLCIRDLLFVTKVNVLGVLPKIKLGLGGGGGGKNKKNELICEFCLIN